MYFFCIVLLSFKLQFGQGVLSLTSGFLPFVLFERHIVWRNLRLEPIVPIARRSGRSIYINVTVRPTQREIKRLAYNTKRAMTLVLYLQK